VTDQREGAHTPVVLPALEQAGHVVWQSERECMKCSRPKRLFENLKDHRGVVRLAGVGLALGGLPIWFVVELSIAGFQSWARAAWGLPLVVERMKRTGRHAPA
jgi:hypothetical protein